MWLLGLLWLLGFVVAPGIVVAHTNFPGGFSGVALQTTACSDVVV